MTEDAGTWTVDWATGDLRHRGSGPTATGHTAEVNAVAIATVDGRSVAVTGSDDETVRRWDLASGEPVGASLTGHGDWVNAVVTAVVHGRPVAVSGGDDGIVLRWDLATGEPLGEPRPVVVSGGADATVRVWDLLAREPVGEPLAGRT